MAVVSQARLTSCWLRPPGNSTPGCALSSENRGWSRGTRQRWPDRQSTVGIQTRAQWGPGAAGCGRVENETMRTVSVYAVAVLVVATAALAQDRCGTPNGSASGPYARPIDAARD